MNGYQVISCFMAKTRGRVCYLKMLRPPWCRQYASEGAKASLAVSEQDLQCVHRVDSVNAGRTKHFIMYKDTTTMLFHRPTNSVVSLESMANDGHSTPLKLVSKDVAKLVENVCKVESNPRMSSCDTDENTRKRAEKISLVDAIQPSDLDWYKQEITVKNLPKYYMMLSKIRLTGLVVATEIVGYAMAPNAFDTRIFILAAVGTALLSSAANTVNQFFEVPFDSQMARTKNRVLVRAVITPLHAAVFAGTCVTCGLSMLNFGVNGLTAALGAANLILYTSIYTPMKRMSIANTWLGSIVGAIPPVMGWTACTGLIDPGALVLGGILFAWQFPHFNALSWNLRGDYSRAGYRMMSVTDPELCRRTALSYSVVLLGLCSVAAPLADLTTYTFALDSLPFNAYLVYLSWRFYQQADSNTSRKLFRFSLIHLPAIMMLMIISKKHGHNKDKDKHQQQLET